MRICQHCGENNWDTAAFCGRCGRPLAENAPCSSPSVESPQTPDGQPLPPQTPYSPYPGQVPPSLNFPFPPVQRRKSAAPTVLGVIGIVFALLLPVVTYACSIPGLVMANREIRSGLPGRAARNLNIAALAVAVVNSILGIALNLSSLSNLL